MLITGGDTAGPGTALLIAAAPVGKGRLVDASSVLPTLAAVPPSAFTGTSAATVVELADPLDPQTVLTRIRAAATAPGPLFLCLVGQLHLDRKQRLPHLALARSTASSLRYTALPWHWLASELTIRRPGTTTVLVDLVADADAWQQIAERGIGLGLSTRLYGRIAPPPARRTAASPEYLKACAAIWRSGARPDLDTLHEQASIQAGAEGDLLLSGTPDPRTLLPSTPVPASVPLPEPVGGPAPRPDAADEEPPLGPHSPAAAQHPADPSGPVRTAPSAIRAPRTVEHKDGDRAPAAEAPPADGPADGDRVPRVGRLAAPAGRARPAEKPAGGQGSTGTTVGVRPEAAASSGTSGPAVQDPHPAILAAARAGRHSEAAAAAAAWEQQELRAHGPGSAQAVHWLEVRADLARLAHEPGLSCELWMTVAETRLAREQTADDPDVEGAVDRAHHQWEQIRDTARARALAPRLVALRRRVPGRQRGALTVLQRRLEHLHSGRS